MYVEIDDDNVNSEKRDQFGMQTNQGLYRRTFTDIKLQQIGANWPFLQAKLRIRYADLPLQAPIFLRTSAIHL